jgi:hypothetical protein
MLSAPVIATLIVAYIAISMWGIFRNFRRSLDVCVGDLPFLILSGLFIGVFFAVGEVVLMLIFILTGKSSTYVLKKRREP